MFHIALFEPKIAPNTGNIIRLMANTGFSLHLIEPLGFSLEEKALRRAGLDYHDMARVSRYQNYSEFLAFAADRRIFAITTKGCQSYADTAFQSDDILLFGSETAGLPASILDLFKPDHRLRIPMTENNRSLNLSNAVAILAYEAWRQTGFDHATL